MRVRFLLWAVVHAPLLPLLVLAGPAGSPILRLELEMHAGIIESISSDAMGRFAVTASRDKTARVWDLADGRLLRVLRPPIASGHFGELYAASLSPDGETVALGGATIFPDNDDPSESTDPLQADIYLFERATGRLRHRINGLPNGVSTLAFSPDGGFLAASIVGDSLRLFAFSSASPREVFVDRDYKEFCAGISFSPDGRLVTVCKDGFLRLYSAGPDFRLLAKAKTRASSSPYCVAFAPDGKHIAVGFEDTTQVDVYDGETLLFQFSPKCRSDNNSGVRGIAWSLGGETLFANATGGVIRAWSAAGRGSLRNWQAGRHSIMDIKTMPDERIMFTASDPAWGVFSSLGQKLQSKESPLPDFQSTDNNLRVSESGRSVQFRYDKRQTNYTTFDLIQGWVAVDAGEADASLKPARQSAPKLKIRNWKGFEAPTLNGRALEVTGGSIALSIARDDQSFLLGGRFYLYRFDASGARLWRVPAASGTRSVLISGDGQVCLAAYGDGTIHWYDYATGRELLTLFPHADRKRWVLWTPEGYYNASPGAEEFIGWHVNNGRDSAADFFPASRFRKVFYRPDVVARVLTTRNTAEALRLADAEKGRSTLEADVLARRPPVVEIIEPSDGTEISSTSLKLSYRLRLPSGEPITSLRVFIDGRPVSDRRGIKVEAAPGQDASEMDIQVPPKDCEVSLIAENRFAASEPSPVRLKWKNPVQPASSDLLKPSLYVLSIGVGRFSTTAIQQLSFPAKDAADFVEALRRQQGGLYRQVKTRVLANEGATRDTIVDGLEWLERQTTSRDVAMLFLSGHGVNDPNGVYYYLPHDGNPAALRRTGLSFSELQLTLRNLPGKALFFVDTCHSGNMMGAGTLRRDVPDLTGLINELTSAENGVVVFASSTGRQYSLERPEWGNGAFTKALVEGLTGRADLLNLGKITIATLDAWIANRVKELTGGQQSPVTTKPDTVPDFPIALKQ